MVMGTPPQCVQCGGYGVGAAPLLILVWDRMVDRVHPRVCPQSHCANGKQGWSQGSPSVSTALPHWGGGPPGQHRAGMVTGLCLPSLWLQCWVGVGDGVSFLRFHLE